MLKNFIYAVYVLYVVGIICSLQPLCKEAAITPHLRWGTGGWGEEVLEVHIKRIHSQFSENWYSNAAKHIKELEA